MKTVWFKLLLPVLCLFSFLACDQKPKHTSSSVHPVFTQTAELKKLTEKITNAPDNARLYYERGLLLQGLKEDSLALMDFNNAVKYDSTRAEYYSAIGDLLFEHKDLDGSVKWIRKAIELNPSDPKAHMKIAKMFVYMGEYPNAFKEINRVLKEDAMNPEAYFLKGMIYKNSADSSNKALSSFLTAVQIMPDYKDALMQIGLIYDKRNDSTALRYYENAFQADTNDVSSLYAKGMYYQTRNRMEEAKNEYARCIRSDKDYSNAYFNTGYILMQQDSLEKARRQFDRVVKLDTANAGAYYNRGLCSESMGKKPEALSDYKQALVLNKDYKEAKDALKRLGE
ncbi:MAG TPA: tetratricopeptide repeat protein [Flavipsychrobacter sp.]|nr:tetratricopeptide repeat protein [Flavipsychrobacter sp.]